MTRRNALISIAACATLALTACGVQLEPPRGEPPAALEGTVAGGTLRVGITPPGRIDPIGAATPAARMITQTMCDTLVSMDPVTRQVKAGLVKNWVEAENGAFLTMLPLHDIKMTDGTILKGRDLDRSMKALLAQYNNSPYRTLALPFKSGVLGGDATNKDKLNSLLEESADDTVNPAQLLNDYDAQYKSNPANSASSRLFTDPAFAPVSHTAMEKDFKSFVANPSCVGPYVLTEPVSSESKTITLKKNPEYFAKNLAYSAGGAGYADTIEFKVYPTQDEAFAAYQSGEVDIAQVPDEATLKPKKLPKDVQGDIAESVDTRMEYLGMPSDVNKKLDAPPVRRALAMALDREAIAKAAGLSSNAATGFFPPSLSIGQGDKTEESGLTLPQCQYVANTKGDVEGAKKLLADAGLSLEGEELQIVTDLSKRHNPVMKEIARQWKEAFGVKIKFNPYEWLVYKDLSNLAGSLNGPFRFSWGTDGVAPFPGTPEIQTYLQQIFVQANQSNSNWTGRSNSEVDKTIRDHLTIVNDQRTRNQIVDGVADQICEDMPYIPLYSSSVPWLIRDKAVGNARTVKTGPDGLPLLRELYLKPEQSS